MVTEFSPQNLANIAWAYATLLFQHQPSIQAITNAAMLCADEFSAQGLANLAWSFATL